MVRAADRLTLHFLTLAGTAAARALELLTTGPGADPDVVTAVTRATSSVTAARLVLDARTATERARALEILGSVLS